MMISKSLKEFRNTKCKVPSILFDKLIADLGYCDEHDGDKPPVVYVYDGALYIESYPNGEYQVVFNNECERHESLALVEEILWDEYAKWEYGMDSEDIMEDLHQRARILMGNIGIFNTSLDDIDLTKIPPVHADRVRSLRRTFQNAEGYFSLKPDKKPEDAMLSVLDYNTNEIHVYKVHSDVDVEDFLLENGHASDSYHYMIAPNTSIIKHGKANEKI
jgi:hypothetical protein